MPKKLSLSHKKKISDGLKKYHKTCKKSKSKSSNTDKQFNSFLDGIKTKTKSKSKSKKEINKKLQQEINKLKKMIQ